MELKASLLLMHFPEVYLHMLHFVYIPKHVLLLHNHFSNDSYLLQVVNLHVYGSGKLYTQVLDAHCSAGFS